MGFLLKRSQPRVMAGYYDDFNRPPESPVQQPWKQFGNSAGWGEINNLQELRIHNFGMDEGSIGGVSFEFDAQTPHWEYETEFWWPANTAFAAEAFYFFIAQSWAKKNFYPSYNKIAAVVLTNTIYDGENISLFTTPAMAVTGTFLAENQSPPVYNGHYRTLRVRVEDDAFFRVYIDEQMQFQGVLSTDYRTSYGKRSVNIATQTTDAWLRWFAFRDVIPTFPQTNPFNTSLFYDNFNGRSGNQNGVNGWTQIGNNAQVVNNSWSTVSGTDGSRGLIRNTGITNGYLGVEAVIGGNLGLNNVASGSLIVNSNSTGTQGLQAKIWGDRIDIARFSQSLSSNPLDWNYYTRLEEGLVNNGDTVGFFCTPAGDAWIEVNGVKKLWAVNTHNVVPASNSWAGLQVERMPFNNSHSWNDVRIKTL